MSKKEKILIILLTIIIAAITMFTIFILINKKNSGNNIEVTYDQDKEEVIDIAGNITTIPNKSYSFTIKGQEIKFCFKIENECLTTTYIEKGNTVTLGDLKDESLSGSFKRITTSDGIILEKKLSNDTTIKYYYIKRQG